ncbi:MAG: YihY/virulence factor BrkB family protein [Acidobacteriaceae bacterium]
MPIESSLPVPPSSEKPKERPAFKENASFWQQALALLRYLSQTEVHTYAFSVAANAILSLFPFIVMMLTLSRNVFHSHEMEVIVGDMMRGFLPTGQEFVVRNMIVLVQVRKGTQLLSMVMLLITSTGVFLPLEVALNQVWGVKKNRSYLRNQLISLGLAFAVGVLAMVSVGFTAAQQEMLGFLFLGHTENIAFTFIAHWVLKIFAVVSSVMLFFLVYWILPNRKLPARAVLPSAIITGLLWEVAKLLYVAALPWLDLRSVYGPFYISVGLMMWAFLSGLLLLGGAHFSASRYAIRLAREAELNKA